MKASVIKYTKLYLAITKIVFISDMIYPFDFFSVMLGKFLEIISYWVFIEIIFAKFNFIAGWNRYEVIAIYGLATFLWTLGRGLVYSNLRNSFKIKLPLE